MYEERIKTIREKNPFISNVNIAYSIILDDIVDGNIPSGIKLNQNQLADEMGMSRSPIREAFIKLESEGFLIKGESGSYSVPEFDLGDYVDLGEFRLAIEPLAAYYAARYISEEELLQLKGLINKWHEAAADSDHAKLLHLDMAFHRAIVEASGNRYLIQTYRMYEKRNLYYRRLVYPETNLHYSYRKHRLIYEKICEHDETGAQEAMRLHLSFYMKNAVRRTKNKPINISHK